MTRLGKRRAKNERHKRNTYRKLMATFGQTHLGEYMLNVLFAIPGVNRPPK